METTNWDGMRKIETENYRCEPPSNEIVEFLRNLLVCGWYFVVKSQQQWHNNDDDGNATMITARTPRRKRKTWKENYDSVGNNDFMTASRWILVNFLTLINRLAWENQQNNNQNRFQDFIPRVFIFYWLTVSQTATHTHTTFVLLNGHFLEEGNKNRKKTPTTLI